MVLSAQRIFKSILHFIFNFNRALVFNMNGQQEQADIWGNPLIWNIGFNLPHKKKKENQKNIPQGTQTILERE